MQVVPCWFVGEDGTACKGHRTTDTAIMHSLLHLTRKVDALMATQDQVNAIVTRVENATTAIGTAVDAIQAGTSGNVDLSGLDSVVTDLTTAVANLSTVAGTATATA